MGFVILEYNIQSNLNWNTAPNPVLFIIRLCYSLLWLIRYWVVERVSVRFRWLLKHLPEAKLVLFRKLSVPTSCKILTAERWAGAKANRSSLPSLRRWWVMLNIHSARPLEVQWCHYTPAPPALTYWRQTCNCATSFHFKLWPWTTKPAISSTGRVYL